MALFNSGNDEEKLCKLLREGRICKEEDIKSEEILSEKNQ